jgi:hypothetical protein
MLKSMVQIQNAGTGRVRFYRFISFQQVCFLYWKQFAKSNTRKLFVRIGVIGLFCAITYTAYGYIRETSCLYPSVSDKIKTNAYRLINHSALLNPSDNNQKSNDQNVSRANDNPDKIGPSPMRVIPIFVPLYFFGLGFFLVMKFGWIGTSARNKK